jgi:hypothetical protein
MLAWASVRCLLWVKLAVFALRPSLPAYPQHQTFPAPAGTSQKGQLRTTYDRP